MNRQCKRGGTNKKTPPSCWVASRRGRNREEAGNQSTAEMKNIEFHSIRPAFLKPNCPYHINIGSAVYSFSQKKFCC